MEKITFTTVKRGKWSKKETAQALYLNIQDENSNNLIGQIAVQTTYSTGTGAKYKPQAQEKALINLMWDDGSILSLSWDDLKAAVIAYKGGRK